MKVRAGQNVYVAQGFGESHHHALNFLGYDILRMARKS